MQGLRRFGLGLWLALGLILGMAAAAFPPAAMAQTPIVTATTTFINYPALGGAAGSGLTNAPPDINPLSAYVWAVNAFTRTMTIFQDNNASDCNVVPGFSSATDTCYSGTVSDVGTAATQPGNFQPNLGSTNQTNQDTNKILAPTETLSFKGSASYHFFIANTDVSAGIVPQSHNVPAGNVDLGSSVTTVVGSPNGEPDVFAFTDSWFRESLAQADWPKATGVLDGAWSWTFGNTCESWTDSFANGYGQSSPITTDGNITGGTCPTPTGPVSNFGDEVNHYGNGFDVFQQRQRVNQPVVGWTATQHDPATHFIVTSEGSNLRFEYAPSGVGVGLCISNPGSGLLVLRGCNTGPWQQFIPVTVGGKSYLESAVGHGVVNPNGKGAQLFTGSAPTSWGGSVYNWTPFANLAA